MKLVISIFLTILILPCIVSAACSPKGNYLCCPSVCPRTDVFILSGNFQTLDENGDGLFEPGEKITVLFTTVLPSCVNSVDFLKVRTELYDNSGNLLKSKVALYSATGEGNNQIEYKTNIKIPENIDTPKILIKLIANATAIHGSRSSREGIKEAFDSCVAEILKRNNLEELPLNETIIGYLKNTKDSKSLSYTIDTEEIYIDKNKFTLLSGKGHPYWELSAYDLAKCIYNWDKCMRGLNTECICCGNAKGYYGAESRGEWSRYYNTTYLKPDFKTISYSGNEKYFNIFWTAEYELPINKKLAVNCFLNDKQSCSSEHFSGISSCTIENPNYFFEENVIKCITYNPTYKKLNTTKILKFSAIDFKTWLGASFGQSFNIGENIIPIYIKNLGLLSDRYNVSYEIISGSNFVRVELPSNYTEVAKKDEIKFVNLKVSFLTDKKATIRICANSVSNPEYCYYGNNMEEKCCQTIEVKGRMISLQDITLIEILLVLIICSYLFFRV